ncbi:MAG: PAS domain S-box protein [Fibrobacteria bacterium]
MSSHSVQFYETDDFLLTQLSRYISSGLTSGETCLVIATSEHRVALVEALARTGMDAEAHIAQSRLILKDAADTLATFMIGAVPDEALFRKALESILAEASASAPDKPLRAFGEMVALLWAKGKADAAVELEGLWENILAEKSIRLLCAYPLHGFRDPAKLGQFLKVCDHHAHILPSEGHSSPELSEGEKLRAIALLQRNAVMLQSQTLEAEAGLTESRQLHAALEVLNKTGASLVAEHDLEKILQLVTDGGREITRAAFGAFFYNSINASGEILSLYTWSGAEWEAFGGFPSPRKTGIFGPTFEGRGPVRYDDITQAPEFGEMGPYHGVPKGHLPVRSYLAVSVISRDGTVLGGLFYGHPQPGVFTERSERLLTNLASQAAVAIDNAKLQTALQAELKQRRLHEQESQQYSAIVRTSSDAIISKDLNSIVTSWNKGAEAIFGYSTEEMIGKSITLLIPANLQDEEGIILARIRNGETIKHYETVRQRKDGKLIQISLTISPIKDSAGNIVGASKIARDITDIKSTEEQLRQSQKMEAIGRLAGGIAHDFNNLLTSINGFTDMALAEVGKESEVADYLSEVKKSGERAAALTQQLLAYSRKQILSPKITNLNEVVTDMDRMLRRVIGEDVTIRTTLHPNLGTVRVDPTQVQQIIVNLAINARDAMPGGGTLALETANVFTDANSMSHHFDAPPGPFVRLSVRDTGTGMSPEVKARIFEPFFTTKPIGQGTGLGLSSVYGIVKQSGGGITFESEPGIGTTFNVFFPLVDSKERTADTGLAPAIPPLPSKGTVLLAEDEGAVRKFLASTLRRSGYKVLEAPDGAIALETGRHAEKLDLLLTDVVMPGLNGGKLAEELKSIHPGIKILFVSGYTKDIISTGVMEGDKDAAFIQKPFSKEDILGKIAQLMNTSR